EPALPRDAAFRAADPVSDDLLRRRLLHALAGRRRRGANVGMYPSPPGARRTPDRPALRAAAPARSRERHGRVVDARARSPIRRRDASPVGAISLRPGAAAEGRDSSLRAGA